MSSWTPTTYKSRNWAEYNLSLKKRDRFRSGLIQRWFGRLHRPGRRGRQQAYSDAAIQACLTCSTKSHRSKNSAALQPTEHTTHANVTMRLLPEMPMPSYRRARMPNYGSPTPRGQSAQRSCESFKVSRPRIVATGDRIPPQKPCRGQDALCEVTRSAPLSARL